MQDFTKQLQQQRSKQNEGDPYTSWDAAGRGSKTVVTKANPSRHHTCCGNATNCIKVSNKLQADEPLRCEPKPAATKSNGKRQHNFQKSHNGKMKKQQQCEQSKPKTAHNQTKKKLLPKFPVNAKTRDLHKPNSKRYKAREK